MGGGGERDIDRDAERNREKRRERGREGESNYILTSCQPYSVTSRLETPYLMF